MSGELAERFAALAALNQADRLWVLNGLRQPELRSLAETWEGWAHDGQFEPEGDWRIWLIRAGRGFGKTRAGAEWVSELARGCPMRASLWSARPMTTCAR